MSEARSTTDPGFHWPEVWEGVGYDWYQDARERRPPDVTTDAAHAALANLIETLSVQPATYWPVGLARDQLRSMFGITGVTALRLLRDCPGSTVLDQMVWCATPAAPEWPAFKQSVRDALTADVLQTLDELVQLVGADAGSVYAALCVLVGRDRSVVCLQESRDDGGPFFVRARPGGQRAQYVDLYTAHTQSAPQPAA
jgi:hypothetical protein